MSPKRLQKSGTFPDVKELGQNKAAHECLYYLIKHYRDLFTVRRIFIYDFGGSNVSRSSSLGEI